jgi:hypothetical protein
MNSSDQQLQDIDAVLVGQITDLIKSNHDVLAVAAVLCKLSLQLYRTTLSDADYNRMVDAISNMRDRITPLKPPQTPGENHLH